MVIQDRYYFRKVVLASVVLGTLLLTVYFDHSEPVSSASEAGATLLMIFIITALLNLIPFLVCYALFRFLNRSNISALVLKGMLVWAWAFLFVVVWHIYNKGLRFGASFSREDLTLLCIYLVAVLLPTFGFGRHNTTGPQINP